MKIRTSWASIIPDACLCIIVIGMFTIWGKIIKILTCKLEADDKIVSGSIGLIKTKSMQSPIKQITSIKVEQGFWGKIFNYGDIYINTASGSFIFNCVSNPTEFRDYITSKMN